MRYFRPFCLRLCGLTIICMIAMASSAIAHDHLTGKVLSIDREKDTITVQSTHDHDRQDVVTIHMSNMPQAIETGSLVHVHGRYMKGDRSRFEATKVEIEDEDNTGVRKRLRKISESKSERSSKSEDKNMPEEDH